jgi:Rrf2 family protein
LQAVFALARGFSRGPVTAAEIARSECIPQKFLEAILAQLRHRGIIESRQGRGGGHRLAARPEQITVGAVIRAVDGSMALLPCSADTPHGRCAGCDSGDLCETGLIMRRVRDATTGIFETTTLAEICEARRSAQFSATYDI